MREFVRNFLCVVVGISITVPVFPDTTDQTKISKFRQFSSIMSIIPTIVHIGDFIQALATFQTANSDFPLITIQLTVSDYGQNIESITLVDMSGKSILDVLTNDQTKHQIISEDSDIINCDQLIKAVTEAIKTPLAHRAAYHIVLHLKTPSVYFPDIKIGSYLGTLRRNKYAMNVELDATNWLSFTIWWYQKRGYQKTVIGDHIYLEKPINLKLYLQQSYAVRFKKAASSLISAAATATLYRKKKSDEIHTR